MNDIRRLIVSPETPSVHPEAQIWEKLGVLRAYMGLDDIFEVIRSIDPSKYSSVYLEDEDVSEFDEDDHVLNIIGVREKTPEDELKERREKLERLRQHRDLLAKQLAVADAELSRRDDL